MRDPTQLPYREEFSMAKLENVITNILDNGLIKGTFTVLIACNEWFFDPNHQMVTAVYVAVMLDTVTGVLKAYKNRNISSSGFFRFALKLLVYLILLLTGATLDKVSPLTGFVSGLSTVAIYLVITESFSTMENVASLGFEVPLKLIKLLKFAHDTAAYKKKPDEKEGDK